MCLSIKVSRPNDVLAEGQHLGFEWAVTNNGRGYRCGYVKVSPGHPWHGLSIWEAENILCHGGVTFAEADVPCGKEGLDNAWWIGFDCAHADDAPDPALEIRVNESPALEITINESEDGLFYDYCYGVMGKCGTARSQEYVEQQCRSLCEQAELAAVVVSIAQDSR